MKRAKAKRSESKWMPIGEARYIPGEVRLIGSRAWLVKEQAVRRTINCVMEIRHEKVLDEMIDLNQLNWAEPGVHALALSLFHVAQTALHAIEQLLLSRSKKGVD